MPPARKSSRRGPGRPRKSVKKSVRKSSRKVVRKSSRKGTRKSSRKSVRKSARKSVRKSARKSVRKGARKSAVRRSVGRPRKYALVGGAGAGIGVVQDCQTKFQTKMDEIRQGVNTNSAIYYQQQLNECKKGLPHNLDAKRACSTI